MVRVRKFIDTNVLEEAKKRIHHIFDTFDTVVVSFSGGKDSLAVLHLVKEVTEERGGTTVNAVFYDEELIQDSVLDFVNEYRQKPWLNLIWLAVPMRSQKYVLGENSRYIQWDPRREWIRPKPEWALGPKELGWTTEEAAIDQTQVDGILANMFPGRIAVVNGIRASESLVRYRASLNKLVENYINAGKSPKTAFCKPIFDWQENDVFRYFYDRGIRYCQTYDFQMWSGDQLRVSTPIHAEKAKRFHKLAQQEPVLYDQVVQLFPEMLVQERYGEEIRKQSMPEWMYADESGIFKWISENITDRTQAALARKRVRGALHRNKRDPLAYSLEHIARQVFNGSYKREILPLDKASQKRARKDKKHD